jgi:PadR family transcriptional regulator, regulatory protein PadR
MAESTRDLYVCVVHTREEGMGSLGELEGLVLLTLLRLGTGAYGVEVRRELRERAGRDVSPGTIYPTLDRLERKGLVSSWMSEPVSERGGRSRRLYAIEPAGLKAARESWDEMRALTRGLESLLEGSS